MTCTVSSINIINPSPHFFKFFLMSCVTCHLSCVTCHVSPVTCHMSHVTCHMSQPRVLSMLVLNRAVTNFPIQKSNLVENLKFAETQKIVGPRGIHGARFF